MTGVNAKASDGVPDADRDAAIQFGEAGPQEDYRSEWKRAINQAVIKCGATASSQELANWIAEHHPYLDLPKSYRKLSRPGDRPDLGLLVRKHGAARKQFSKDVSKIKADIRRSKQ